MLLGVCLVVSGDFGNRLLFRYPPLKLRTAQTAGTTGQHRDITTGASTTGRPTPITTTSSSSPPAVQSTNSLSVPSSAIRSTARLTSTGPITDTAALQRLNDLDDLDPDDIPPPLPPAVLAQAAAANNPARRFSLQPAQQLSVPASVTALNASPAVSGTSTTALPLSEKEDIWGMPLYEFTRLFSPLSSHLASSLFDVAVNSVRFLSFPIRLPSESRHEMTMFNVVFVLSANTNFTLTHTAPTQQSTHATQPVASLMLALYSAILIQLSRALEHEQKRCGFLSYHSSLMTQLRDRYIRALQVGGEAEKGGLAAVLVRESLLAEHLYRLHRGLVKLERYYYVEEGKQGEVQQVGEKRRRRRGERRKASEDTLTHVHLLVNDWYDTTAANVACTHRAHATCPFVGNELADAFALCIVAVLQAASPLHTGTLCHSSIRTFVACFPPRHHRHFAPSVDTAVSDAAADNFTAVAAGESATRLVARAGSCDRTHQSHPLLLVTRLVTVTATVVAAAARPSPGAVGQGAGH